MTITGEIPKELARGVIAAGRDPARESLEAISLRAYRRDRRSEADIRKPSGSNARTGAPGFLKEHSTRHYRYEDLEHDRPAARQEASGARAVHPSDASGRNAGN